MLIRFSILRDRGAARDAPSTKKRHTAQDGLAFVELRRHRLDGTCAAAQATADAASDFGTDFSGAGGGAEDECDDGSGDRRPRSESDAIDDGFDEGLPG